MYILVTNGDYTGDTTSEVETMEGVLNELTRSYCKLGDLFYALYKVEREYTLEEVEVLIEDQENRKLNAIAVAKAKLTPDELVLLGIK